MKNYMAVVEYDGTGYSGFQIQPGDIPTIAGELKRVLSRVLCQDINFSYSGRTDAGVHALYQVINFKFGQEIDLYKFKWSVNSLLPENIGIRKINKVNNEFDARKSAKRREYSYYIVNGNFQSVFLKKYSILIAKELDLELMEKACKLFVGKKDFKAFSKACGGSNNTVRIVYKFDLIKSSDNLIIFNIAADSFLYNMVRIIVATVLDLGMKNRNIESIKQAFKKKDRKLSERPVEAKGLFLTKVLY